MAIYHMEAKVITRGEGRTACGAAAYMSCSRLYNEYDGVQHDYTRKGGLVWEHVFLPPMAPAAWQDRETLWNAVEESEKTKDSRLAREFIVALPVELEKCQWINLVSEFIQDSFVSDGMCADVAIHDTDGHNPHAHILLTMRPLNQDGTWQYKTEKEYLCVRDEEEQGFTAAEFKAAQGEGWEKQYPYKVGKKKVYMTPSAAEAQRLERASKYPKSTKYGRQNPITARWNSEEQLKAWRAVWADTVNLALERAGRSEHIDHRSHAERGLDEHPTIHEGVSARKMEKAGFISERCEINRQIRADNAVIRTMKAAIVKLKKIIETTIPAIATAMETIRQNIIVFNYGLLFVRDRRKEASEYVDRATREYGNYKATHSQIMAKIEARKQLQKEHDRLSVFSIGKRRELKAKITELSEEIEELRFEEKSVMRVFGKEDAAGMNEVKGEISEAETRVMKLDAQEVEFTGAINREKDKFDGDGLKEQASDLDHDELIDARLALRPQMERSAYDRIQSGLSSGKPEFWKMESSFRDADRVLGEEGMAERHEAQKRREEHEFDYQPQKRESRSKGPVR